MPRQEGRAVSKRELEKQKQALFENGAKMGTPALTEEYKEATQPLFDLTLEADNVFIEFTSVDSYRAATIKHELIQFCQSLRIIENTIIVTKTETENTGDKI